MHHQHLLLACKEIINVKVSLWDRMLQIQCQLGKAVLSAQTVHITTLLHDKFLFLKTSLVKRVSHCQLLHTKTPLPVDNSRRESLPGLYLFLQISMSSKYCYLCLSRIRTLLTEIVLLTDVTAKTTDIAQGL